MSDALDRQPVGRLVTLVLVDADGALLGSLEPFAVETPWWQDVLPIVERVPDVTVLRLLDCGPSNGGRMGGAVTYLGQLGEGAAPGPLRRYGGELPDHPLRMPWARPGGPAADLAWAGGVVGLEGPPVQHRTWNLSAIWSIPASRSTVWLKCVPPFFAHEAGVLGLLEGEAVPRVLGAEGHRMLLEELPGRDGYDASPDEHVAAVEALVDLQLRTVGREPELLAAGVPDCRAAALIGACADVVARRAPQDERLRRLLDSAPKRLAEVAECGLPDVLVHGDAHPGNTRLTEVGPIWFDWGDSRLGHPLLDLVVLDGPTGDGSPNASVAERWLELWAEAVPGSDPRRAWRLLRPLAQLRLAAVYQSFLDHIEPTERPFHEEDVLPALERAARLV
jgi:hypothetical protein